MVSNSSKLDAYDHQSTTHPRVVAQIDHEDLIRHILRPLQCGAMFHPLIVKIFFTYAEHVWHLRTSSNSLGRYSFRIKEESEMS